MNERKIWFITRPERDPKFHRDALIALREATNDFSVKWSGNREAHLLYERVLVANGVKRDNISNDGSGGRTWCALLKTFAYIYTDEGGFLKLTKVGKKIIDGVNIRENVTKQILTLQFPNAYFLEPGFKPKFATGFKIRPARFLIKLANQELLDYYVTKEEIVYFVLTAKADNELDTVTDNILRFRKAKEKEKYAIKEDVERFDHRERSDRDARDFISSHGDVAHTFMLICDYTGLAEYIRGQSLRVKPSDSKKVSAIIEDYDNRYPFNTRYLISLQRMAENNGLDIESYKANRFGLIKPASNRAKTENKILKLLCDYPDLDVLTLDDLKTILMKEFSSREAEEYAQKLKGNIYGTLNTDFVEGYLNETNNRSFEDKTGQIFKALGFEVDMRPALPDVKTEIEIVLKYNNDLMGIIDAKNYREKFDLSSSLASHMASEYIPNYNGYEGRTLTFFGYVTASSWSGAKNLEKISNLAKRTIPDRNINGIMINANALLGLLDYCIDNNLPKTQRISLFTKAINNQAFSNINEIITI